MESVYTSSTLLACEDSSAYDEISMDGTIILSDCLERLRTCQDYIDHQGLAEQSLAIATPKYQTHYILPGNSSNGSERALVQRQNRNQDENGWNAPRVEIGLDDLPPIKEISPSLMEKPSSPSPLPQPAVPYLNGDKQETRPVSPIPSSHPLVRSGSVASRTSSPTLLRHEYRFPSLPRRSASIHFQPEKEEKKEEAIPSKSKKLFNALLGRRKWKEDPMLYTYLDEY